MPEFKYRKSSFSDPEAECVEIATNVPTAIAIRDSKNPNGPSIRLHPTSWCTFQSALGKGEFSRPGQALRA